MPQRIRGIAHDSIRQPEETGVLSNTGIASSTVVELVPVSEFSRLLKPVGSPHPRFTGLFLERATWDRLNPGAFYKVTYIYSGTTFDKLPDPVYELSGGLSEEPIETHPQFESFAGTPAAPLHGAIFIDPETSLPTKDNARGVFKEFGRGAKAGVTTYYNPSLTWTKSWAQKAKPSDGETSDIGNVSIPEGGAPNVSPRNWLLYNFEYSKRGGVYECRKTWLMSDRRGWDSDIYNS